MDSNWLQGRIPDGYLGNIQGTNHWSGDPQLDGNFRPLAGSPVIGKGSSLGVNPTVDLDGAARTQPVLGCRV